MIPKGEEAVLHTFRSAVSKTNKHTLSSSLSHTHTRNPILSLSRFVSLSRKTENKTLLISRLHQTPRPSFQSLLPLSLSLSAASSLL